MSRRGYGEPQPSGVDYQVIAAQLVGRPVALKRETEALDALGVGSRPRSALAGRLADALGCAASALGDEVRR